MLKQMYIYQDSANNQWIVYAMNSYSPWGQSIKIASFDSLEKASKFQIEFFNANLDNTKLFA